MRSIGYAFLVACLLPGSAIADTTTLKSSIQLSWLGLGVAKLDTAVRLDGNSYAISGGMKTTGIVRTIRKTRGTFQSSGTVRGRRLVPDDHRMVYSSGKKRGDLKFTYASGDLVKKTVNPKVKYKKGTVPVEPVHFRDVLDPVSGTLFAVRSSEVGSGTAICNRTLPIFDGKNRMNVAFRYKSSGVARAKGFKGKTFTCSARYEPVSGHRPFKKNVKFMKANRNLEITVARIGDSNVYGLFGFRVATGYGTASGRATRFQVN